MLTVLITGGTGTIGKHLSQLLQSKGYKVIILTRKAGEHKSETFSYAEWDVEKGILDIKAVLQADYIIHLAGAGVADKKWTGERKQEIVDSRVKSSTLIIKALQENEHKVKAVISASAIGWYGPDNAESKTNGYSEKAEATDDFLGDTCRLWEESIQPVESMGIRLVKLRTGIVLSNEGGAYVEFKKPVKFGIAAILDGGDQVVSWIHVEDVCRMYWYALQNEAMRGVYNAVAPKPVTNKQLTLELAKQLRGKLFIPVHVPSFILKWMLGEMSIEVLKSTTVNAAKVKSTGFQFMYPTIEAAIQELVGKK